MNKLSLIIPYYNHPNFLKFQSGVWSSYSDKVKEEVEIIVVDDGSKVPINEVPGIVFPENVKLYRILEDIPWNEKGARNLGGFNAEAEWLLHTDFDMWFDNKNLEKILDMKKDKGCLYRFNRLVNEKQRIHRETHLISKEVFITTGGFDENYSGIWGGKAYLKYFKKLETLKVSQTFVKYIEITTADLEKYPDCIAYSENRADLKKNRVFLSKEELYRRKKDPRKILKFDWKKLND